MNSLIVREKNDKTIIFSQYCTFLKGSNAKAVRFSKVSSSLPLLPTCFFLSQLYKKMSILAGRKVYLSLKPINQVIFLSLRCRRSLLQFQYLMSSCAPTEAFCKGKLNVSKSPGSKKPGIKKVPIVPLNFSLCIFKRAF